jgi:acetyl-CoA carboxylase biotin carboxyl carrier protein
MAEREVDAGRVRALAALLDETGLGEIEYETKEWRVRVVKQGVAAPAHVVAAAPPPEIGRAHV